MTKTPLREFIEDMKILQKFAQDKQMHQFIEDIISRASKWLEAERKMVIDSINDVLAQDNPEYIAMPDRGEQYFKETFELPEPPKE